MITIRISLRLKAATTRTDTSVEHQAVWQVKYLEAPALRSPCKMSVTEEALWNVRDHATCLDVSRHKTHCFPLFFILGRIEVEAGTGGAGSSSIDSILLFNHQPQHARPRTVKEAAYTVGPTSTSTSAASSGTVETVLLFPSPPDS